MGKAALSTIAVTGETQSLISLAARLHGMSQKAYVAQVVGQFVRADVRRMVVESMIEGGAEMRRLLRQ